MRLYRTCLSLGSHLSSDYWRGVLIKLGAKASTWPSLHGRVCLAASAWPGLPLAVEWRYRNSLRELPAFTVSQSLPCSLHSRRSTQPNWGTHTHLHTHTHTHTHSPTHTPTPTITDVHSLTHTRTQTHILTLSHTHTHWMYRIFKLVHTDTYTHTHTVIFTHTH
jgi:hypothetical protein